MDKRFEKNRKAKLQIVRAFFMLLEKQDETGADNISVTSITKNAGVSRMAYYRNFSSKPDIIEYYLREVIWPEIKKAIGEDEPVLGTLTYDTEFYRAMKLHRDDILLLDRHGYSGIILNVFNETNEALAGDMPVNSIDRFQLYYSAGAAFNSALIWLKEGCRETPEEMARCRQLYMHRPDRA